MTWCFSRTLRRAAGGALLVTLFAAPGFGEGFGTPTMDGLLTGDESIYNAAEASDGVDPPQDRAGRRLPWRLLERLDGELTRAREVAWRSRSAT